jgi:hypothetical protein
MYQIHVYFDFTVFSGEGKLKNMPVEGRNRRVLQDIGNLVAKRAVEGKPHHAQISQNNAKSVSVSVSVSLSLSACSYNNNNSCLAGNWLMHKQLVKAGQQQRWLYLRRL